MNSKNRVLLAVALAVLLGAAAGGGAVCLLAADRSEPPATKGTMTVNGTVYYWTNVTVPVNEAFQPCCHQMNVSFEGVRFRLFIYGTMECDVLNVTGTELGGSTYSFLFYASPMDCRMSRPMVFAPDASFGAICYQTSTVTLLVREA